MLVERLIEGDRNERMRLDQAPLSRRQGRAEDRQARGLARHRRRHRRRLDLLLTSTRPRSLRKIFHRRGLLEVYFFIGLFTATTYLLAGWAREQVCTYMCPWPRFQGAMLDEQSVIVTYQEWRGEPRGKHKAGGSWDGPRRLRRLRPVRRVCPTGDRHPQRPADRLHRLRPVHRRLQRDDGEGRPPARPDPLRHARRPAGQASAARASRVAAAPAAHHRSMPRLFAVVAAVMLAVRRCAATPRAHRPARPQPHFVRAVERRHPQRLHRQDPQQAPARGAARSTAAAARWARRRRASTAQPATRLSCIADAVGTCRVTADSVGTFRVLRRGAATRRPSEASDDAIFVGPTGADAARCRV